MTRPPSGMTIILWVVGLLLSVAMGACEGGGEADLTASSIGEAELGTMAVYEVDLPEEFAGFVRTEESGFKTNEQSAESHFDSADESQDLERFGQVSEYFRAYESPGGGGSATQEEAISFVSGVRLFGDALGASGYLKDELADMEGSVGKDVGGATVEEVERFGIGGIADEAVGVRTRMVSGGEGSERLTYGTQVFFRRGRLLLGLVAVRTDDKDVGGELEVLARSLDERIQVILQATPVVNPTLTQ